MATPAGGTDRAMADACAELRLDVAARCEEAHVAAQAQAGALDETRARKRDLVAAQRFVESAEAAGDPVLRQADKAAARDAYLLGMKLAESDGARQEVTATWAATIDRINRQGRLTARALARARTRSVAAEEALQLAQRSEQTLRMRAEAAQAACLEGRVRLAACEERAAGVQARAMAADEPTTAGTPVNSRQASHARLGVSIGPEPLVVEAIVSGDDRVLDLAVLAIAERAALSPAEVRLQLRELIDAIAAVAGEEGFLVFDVGHPVWSQLTPEESRDVVSALARLGFQLEPGRGWHAGRQPSPGDLSMALGYAGLDTRLLRTLPGHTDLAALPASIGVDARAFLAARAPDLAVDQLVRVLGDRARALGSLWDAWGLVRPVLFSESRTIEARERAASL
jgi:hypothetical protein